MAYDDLKEFEGEEYSGMPIGGEHAWIYPHGLWRERKVAPNEWEFDFTSIKEREQAAPPGSGCAVGTQYHWYLLAHQRVRKVDADTYHTFMSGLKVKLAHRRPHWRKWSSEYPGQTPERERVIEILEETIDRLRREPGTARGPSAALRVQAEPSVRDVPEPAPALRTVHLL